MARPPRLSFPGAHFHLLNRFVDRHPFFQAEADYRCFLDTYFRFAGLHGVRTFAYCLMPNHFHVVAETERGGLSAFLQQVMSRVAHELNKRHDRVGHLFQGRTKSFLVEDGGYFVTVCGYVLMNPVRAGLCRLPLDYRWSSAATSLGGGEFPVDAHALAERLEGRPLPLEDRSRVTKILLEWMNSLQAVSSESQYHAGRRGAFISSSRFRKQVLSSNERRARRTEARRRRWTDREMTSATWEQIQKAAGEAVDHAPRAVLSAWRSDHHARADSRVFIAHRFARWTLDRIRKAEMDRYSTSRYSMALTEMSRQPLKAELARQIGVRLAVSQSGGGT